METVFSTRDVHPRDRFSYWHDIACRNIVIHDSKPADRPTFQAAIRVGAVADIGIILFENSPMEVARTSRQVARATNDDLFICRQLSGVLGLEQNGRNVVVEAGDVTLIDPLVPYLGKFSSNSNTVVLKLPRCALEARLGKTQEIVARCVKPSEGEPGLISSFIAMLPAHAGKMRPPAEEIIRDQILDLLAVSFANIVGMDRPRLSSSRSLALMRLRAAIETRLSNPSLDAAAAAAAAGVSIRYANAMLAVEGTSIMRLIQTRRLARCRTALADPMQMNRTLREIAFGWGFSDMTHFSRRFKATYGMLPSEYRRLVERP